MEPLILMLVTLVAAAAGAYLGSYLREKGKNLATKEDVDRIVRQTEEIKAQVSGTLWVEQKRWDLKRDLYARLLESLDEASLAMGNLSGVLASWPEHDGLQEQWNGLKAKAEERMSVALREIRRATAVAAIMLSDEAITVLNKLRTDWSEARREEDYFEALDLEIAATRKAYDLLVEASRRDLLGMKIGGE